MATLWIREYESIGAADAEGRTSPGWAPGLPIPQEPGVDQTPVTFSTAAQSAAFGTKARYVAIIGSAAFHYLVGANPTATTSHLKVPADTPLFLGVTAGQKLSVIAAA